MDTIYLDMWAAISPAGNVLATFRTKYEVYKWIQNSGRPDCSPKLLQFTYEDR